MLKYTFDINANGNRLERIPKCHYNYVTVYNNTRFDFNLHSGLAADVRNLIGNCPPYTIITFPIDKFTDQINFVWASSGPALTINERCQIFLTEENLQLVGQFRPPLLGEARDIFNGNASVATLVTASRKISISAMYFANRDGANSTITFSFRRGGVDTHLLSNLAIPANSTLALGVFELLQGDSLVVNAVTGNISIIIVGQGV